jgi:hypothetical protein
MSTVDKALIETKTAPFKKVYGELIKLLEPCRPDAVRQIEEALSDPDHVFYDDEFLKDGVCNVYDIIFDLFGYVGNDCVYWFRVCNQLHMQRCVNHE